MDFCGKTIYGSGKAGNRHDLEMVEVPLKILQLWPYIQVYLAEESSIR